MRSPTVSWLGRKLSALTLRSESTPGREMSYSVTCQASAEAKHLDDVESCVYSNGRLYTGSDDGFIKVRAG